MVSTRRTDIHPPPVTAAWLVQSAGAESHTTYTGEVWLLRAPRVPITTLALVHQCLSGHQAFVFTK